MPDLESSETRSADPDKEEKVRHAAEMAIKEIRLYGFEVCICSGDLRHSPCLQVSFC